MQSKYPAALLVAVVCLMPGCDTGTGFNLDPALVRDTVLVAAPLPRNSELPTALDITGDGLGGIRGGRFPERSRDALRWDFAVRIRNGQVVLIPAAGVGISQSRAALTPAIQGETFEGLRETPGQSTFLTDSAIVMVEGAVYAARSRETTTTCAQFAKLQPLEVSVAEGLLRLQIVTNQLCGDARLVPLD